MRFLILLIDFLIICGLSNSPLFFMTPLTGPFPAAALTIMLSIGFLVVNITPGSYKVRKTRLRILAGGSDLLMIFLPVTVVDSLILSIMLISGRFELWQHIVYAVVAVTICGITFWNGIIRVYITSGQLGITLRVLGAVFGMFPIINIIFLFRIIARTQKEAAYEIRHDAVEAARAGQNICATKYPILMVHGVFFRDRNIFNYWGRIPEALTLNGAKIYYGNQQSALSVKDSGAELAKRIEDVIKESGAEKLNIIAHSKGGLDSRYALSAFDCGKYVASLTTVNTPHRGCIFVDKIFDNMPQKSQQKLADAYNASARAVGDTTPDFLAAVGDLRESRCIEMNKTIQNCDGVFYQSVGSVSKGVRSGRFPMDISYPFVKKTDGENDGLVSVDSMKWGEKFHFITTKGRRGVTHGDVIDLNRENIDGFDVREYFVQLVAELKNNGF